MDSTPLRFAFRRLAPAAIVFALCTAPTDACARDGTWAQLGVPFRFASPLLFDSVAGRYVGIGASAFGAADSVEDAWEFREATGWRRIRLPQPPQDVTFGFERPIADPARRRFVHLAFDDGTLDSLRLWALELGPEPHWACLDVETKAPFGRLVPDVSGRALWIETSWTVETELWSRSLADSGRWRRVRRLPQGGAFRAGYVDAAHDRCIELRFGSDSATVSLLTLSGTQGWEPAPTGGAASPKGYPRLVIADEARERLLCFFENMNPSGDDEVWALDLSGEPRWVRLGVADYSFDHSETAIAAGTLVLHGQSPMPGQPGARAIAVALGEPTKARVLFAAAWPPPMRETALVPDGACERWLLVGTPSGEAAQGSPPGSVWELRLTGYAATWSLLATEGSWPSMDDSGLWAVDEAGGTLFRLCGWNTASGTPSGPRELWALHPESPPRWELIHAGAADDWPRLGWAPVFVFDEIRRRLVCFGDRSPVTWAPVNEVWEYDVVARSGWEVLVPSGTPPAINVSTTAAFDPISSRVVAAAVDRAIVTLTTSPDRRWTAFACPNMAGGECLPVQFGMQGVFDPIGRRLVELGGFDSSWPNIGGGHQLYEVSAGDSVGSVRQMQVLGSPGWRDVPTMRYDRTRDALLVFGDSRRGRPDLVEFVFDRSGRRVARPRSWAALSDRNELRWSAAAGARFLLWRGSPGNAWAPLGPLTAAASGELAYDDRAIEAGTRYGYRLTVAASPLEPAAADVWLTAATASSFALGAPWPNPVHASLSVAFTSAAASPAVLELFDVAGRRVWSRRWEAPAPGPHHAVIGTSELPRAGFYFLRLRQAALSATRRVVLAP